MHTTTQLAALAMRDGAPDARIAHATLFERVVGRIHSYFRRMLRDPHDAEECLQETLLLLERSLSEGTYDPERSFNAWMWLKARTVYAQFCRARGTKPPAQPLASEPPARRDGQAAVEQALDAAVLLEQLRQRLGDECFEAFVLYYEGGLTQADVAAAQQCDRKTVRRRLRQAHELLDRLRAEP